MDSLGPGGRQDRRCRQVLAADHRPAESLHGECDLTSSRWLDDVEAGAWIELDDTRALPPPVAALVPRSYEAFARVFHPLHAGFNRMIRWSEAAASHGRVMHATVALHEVLLREGEFATDAKLISGQGVGTLPAAEFRALWGVLRPHTTSDLLYLGFWEGFFEIEPPGERPYLEVADRRHLLAALPTDALDEAHLLNRGFGPNLVWPADRAWFCHTDIDGLSSYVGATATAIEAVLGHAGLEAMAVSADDPANY